MIQLKDISDSVKKSHWDYFKSTSQYKKISDFASDSSLSLPEKNFYEKLNSEELFLKKIIIGNPKELLEVVDYYNDQVLSAMPVIKINVEFNKLLSWDEIEKKINRAAEKKFNKAIIIERKKNLINEISKIESELLSQNLITSYLFKENLLLINDNKLFQNLIKKYFNKIKLFFKVETKGFYDRFFAVFNYESFVKGNDVWGAYQLTKTLDCNVCPYCNRNYIHTIQAITGKFRPELDHYYPKSRFPFLALSLYNLIPSCHTCNSSLKGSIDFYNKSHIHPYNDNVTEMIEFIIDITNNDGSGDVIPAVDDFSINIEINTTDDMNKEKILNSIETFLIKEQYDLHKDIAREILQRIVYYNESRLIELNNFFAEDEDKIEVLELHEETKKFVLGNYVENELLGKRTLSKFTRDIAMGTEMKKFIS
jgi:hypothetical protein